MSISVNQPALVQNSSETLETTLQEFSSARVEELMDGVSTEVFSSCDSDLQTTPVEGEGSSASSSGGEKDTEAEAGEEEEESDDMIDSITAVRFTTAVTKYAMANGLTDIVEFLESIAPVIRKDRLKKKGQGKQTTMMHFFKKS